MINKIHNKKDNIKIIRVAGVTFNNDDGTSRQKILAKLLANGKTKARLVKYKYDGEVAIKVITEYGMIGNIPREDIQSVLKKTELIEDINIEIQTFKDENHYKKFYCDILIKYAKNKKELEIKKIYDDSKTSNFNIILECEDEYFNKIIDYSIKIKELDKNSLYNGLSKTEIRDLYTKVYECNDYIFPCNILYNEEKNYYDVYYKLKDKDVKLGHISSKSNRLLDDIINNKNIIYGGILLLGGKYIEYDLTDKMYEGIDKYSATLRIRYKV